jgi:vesicle coat complex subunit
VQYVALRNIDLLLQKQPDILNKELRVFFCKYNDPPYVKFQKLEIMVRIANDRNVDQLLAELKEYALEVDMDFVRRAVKAIGQVAIKIESASEKCVNTLLDLINTKVNYVVQEAIVVIKDIFRKYPGYEGIIPTLCKCIDELDEPNARAALIWIVGEYAEKISNAGDILGGFVDGFNEEFSQTQLQILTAVVKLFLKRPEKAQGLVQRVLQAATAENDNPDVRDRAYIYWRLLSNTSDQDATKNIVLSDKPPIVTTISSLPPALLEQLLQELSTLSSVYHKPPEQFVGQGRFGADAVQRAAIEYVIPPFITVKVFQANHFITGNNSKMLGRIPWPPLPRLLSAVPHPLRRRKTTSRICWTLISTVVPRPLPTRSHLARCPAWKVWQAPPSECNLPRLAPLRPRPATTSTTCWESLAILVLRSPHPAEPMVALRLT